MSPRGQKASRRSMPHAKIKQHEEKREKKKKFNLQQEKMESSLQKRFLKATDAWTDGDGPTNGRTDEQKDGWMDGWTG